MKQIIRSQAKGCRVQAPSVRFQRRNSAKKRRLLAGPEAASQPHQRFQHIPDEQAGPASQPGSFHRCWDRQHPPPGHSDAAKTRWKPPLLLRLRRSLASASPQMFGSSLHRWNIIYEKKKKKSAALELLKGPERWRTMERRRRKEKERRTWPWRCPGAESGGLLLDT